MLLLFWFNTYFLNSLGGWICLQPKKTYIQHWKLLDYRLNNFMFHRVSYRNINDNYFTECQYEYTSCFFSFCLYPIIIMMSKLSNNYLFTHDRLSDLHCIFKIPILPKNLFNYRSTQFPYTRWSFAFWLVV